MSARDALLAIPDDLLRSGKIAQGVLTFMDFKDNPKRWWTGFGDLDHAGHRWQGVDDMISVSPISSSYTYDAEQVTFEMAAKPEWMAIALNEKARMRDRSVIVYLQLFAMVGMESPDGRIQAGHPIGDPIALFSGTMQRMPWSASGPSVRTLKLEAEGLFFRRNAPPRGRWTDADQKARYAGDRGFERLPLYAAGHEARWRG